MYYIKVHEGSEDKIVAACDTNIVGETFSEDNLSITANKEFYLGSKVNAAETLALLKEATIINLLGKNIVNLAVEKELIEKNHIITIDGIPHAQAVYL